MKNSKTLKILSLGKEKRANQTPIFIQREMITFQKGSFPLEVKGVGLKGKGLLGYIKSYFQLKKIIKHEKPDVIHAHYSFSGVIAILASPKRNVVVTFLGSDVFFSKPSIKFAKWFVTQKAAQIIAVSDRIRATFSQQDKVTTIPQGIDVDLFKPLDKKRSANDLGWNTNKTNILFPSSRNRFEKNYNLAKEAIDQLKSEYNIDFYYLEGIDSHLIPIYLNASDIVLLTSKWEGSSNIIKEAMACNAAVVSTDVGDARELFQDLNGYFLTSHNVEDVITKIKKAMAFQESNRIANGRQRILNLGLDDITIANKILNTYKKVVKQKT